MKVCLDPGHGGSDPGAVGPSGLEEALVNLALCQYIDQGLRALKLDTLLTRTANVAVSLGDRAELANDWGADIFVSIHLNSDGPEAVGIETLYKTAKGEQLARPIQEALIAATGDTDRGLKHRDDLYVLNTTRMPAVLAEVGFISHPHTEQKFCYTEYRLLVAHSIVTGIAAHFNIGLETPPPKA